MTCIDGKGSRTFCGKEECKYHFDKSFASFQGMCCGASDSKECEESGCNCGKKKVDCWDQQKNGDITPFMVSNGSNKKFYFICNLCKHSWNPSLDKVTSKNEQRWCPPCGKKKQIFSQTKPLHEFVEQAKLKHNRKYSYEKTLYVNSTTLVTITCPKHGDWSQLPSNHLWGFGCEKCGIEQRSEKNKLSIEIIRERSNKIHENKYYVISVEHSQGEKTMLKIKCSIHGEFNQAMNDHLSGQGCYQCGKKKMTDAQRSTKEEFIKKAKDIHGDTYDYSLVEYVDSRTNVKLICKIHDQFIFMIQPSNHLFFNEYGCQKCGYERTRNKKRLSHDVFIKRVNMVHGDLYDYSKSVYQGYYTPLIIICKKHGEFEIEPCYHFKGAGCYSCNNQSSKPSREWLSMIQSSLLSPLQTNDSSYGEYTIPTTKFRADGYNPLTNTIYEFHGSFWHGDPLLFSHDMINPKTCTTMGELYQNTLDKKRRCIELGYNYVEIWESQWSHFKKFIRMVQLRFRKSKI